MGKHIRRNRQTSSNESEVVYIDQADEEIAAMEADDEVCRALHPDNDLACLREKGHADGQHMSWGSTKKAIFWPVGSEQKAKSGVVDPYGKPIEDKERDGHLGEVIDRRVQVYGDPTSTFVRIAQVWTGILGHEVQPVEVPLLMAGLKTVRAQVMPDYSDNSDDIDGYMDIFRTIVGEDMIHARTVNEFIEKKWGTDG